jgi:hypothetical protein
MQDFVSRIDEVDCSHFNIQTRYLRCRRLRSAGPEKALRYRLNLDIQELCLRLGTAPSMFNGMNMQDHEQVPMKIADESRPIQLFE